MREKMVVVVGLLFVWLLGGCVAQDAREALDATALAQQRIGSSGSQALSGVAALTSKCGETIDAVTGAVNDARPIIHELAGVTFEAHAATTALRQAIDDGWLSRKLFYAVVIGFVVLLVHAELRVWQTKKRLEAMHSKLTGLLDGIEVVEPEDA